MIPRPPISPVLARLENELPKSPGWLFEPKLDGFRGLIFNIGGRTSLWSRNGKDLGGRFPELLELGRSLPDCVIDGEIIAVRDGRTDFEALQERLVGNGELGAAYVAFDLIAMGKRDLRQQPLSQRRASLETLGLEVIPQTDSREAAAAWMDQHDLGIEGVVAKKSDERYREGERSWIKVKSYRTVDLVVGGLTPSWGLLLGAFGEDGRFHHVATTSPLKMEYRLQLERLIEDLVAEQSFNGHRPEMNRWDSHRTLAWTPLRPALVAEVSYSRMDSGRVRHSARFLRWRPDKSPADCRLS